MLLDYPKVVRLYATDGTLETDYDVSFTPEHFDFKKRSALAVNVLSVSGNASWRIVSATEF